MSLNKLILAIREFMTRRKPRGSGTAAIENLRVQLIPVQKENADLESRRKMVGELIGMMVLNLRKRGRPKKTEEGGFGHAI